MPGYKRLKETGLVIDWADVGRFGIADVRYLYIDVWTSPKPECCFSAWVIGFGGTSAAQVTPQSIGRDSISDLPETSRLARTNAANFRMPTTQEPSETHHFNDLGSSSKWDRRSDSDPNSANFLERHFWTLSAQVRHADSMTKWRLRGRLPARGTPHWGWW